jgi:Holliday junction DNA helicase RuvB
MSDQVIDTNALRPKTLDEYIGQENVIKTLKLFLQAVKGRGEATEHILFYGPPGIGKTTLSNIIANELEGNIRITSGAAITKTGDLAAILTNLKDKDVLFIDEIHRLPKPVEEMLYPVIEEFFLDIVIGKGPSARTVRLPIPKVTIVGATTKLALLSAPLRDRFGLVLRLDYYTDGEMSEIVRRSAEIMNVKVEKDAINEISRRARKTPRIANRILKRARDLVEVDHLKVIDQDVVDRLFTLLEIDEEGLSDIDIQYMKVIAERFQNSPVGVETIASALSEDRRTIEEFIEPYLLRLGFIKKTPRGRVVTPKGCKHLKIVVQDEDSAQKKLI